MSKPTLLLGALLLLALVNTGALAAKVPKPSSICKVSYPSDTTVEWECYRLKKRDTLEGLFGERWVDVLRFNRIDRRHLWPGAALKVPKRLDDIRDFTPLPAFYPPAETDPKFILVDLSEQFIGAYENGFLKFSFPIASGNRNNKTPTGTFRVDAYHSLHTSNLYYIEKTNTLYPMHYALRFHISPRGIAYFIHGRDVPGYPASHGCIGLYDEEMQIKYYKWFKPREPLLLGAKTLFDWAIAPSTDDYRFHRLKNGPRVEIIGNIPF